MTRICIRGYFGTSMHSLVQLQLEVLFNIRGDPFEAFTPNVIIDLAPKLDAIFWGS